MADLQEIVDDLEAEIRRPISVEDRRWRLLAHSAQPDEADAVRRSSILTRETSPDVVAWLDGLGLQRARDLVDVPRNDDLGMIRRGCLPIRHGDVLLGFLWVIVGDSPLSDAETRRARSAAGRRSRRTSGRRHRAADERARRTREHLAGAAATARTSAGLAATLRWPETGAYAVAVCDETTPPRRRSAHCAARDVRTSAGRRTILVRDPLHLAKALAEAVRNGGVSAPFTRLARRPGGARARPSSPRCAPAPAQRSRRRLRRARQLGADRLAVGRRRPPGSRPHRSSR